MRAAFLLLVPLLLAACDRREVVAICASFGDPNEQVTAAYHAQDGARRILIFDAATGQTSVIRDTIAPPILTQLWRVAETTMRALPEVEASPCGLSTISTVTVTFNDGSTTRRQTSCLGNALARVTSEILDASEMERPEAEIEAGLLNQGPTTMPNACEILS